MRANTARKASGDFIVGGLYWLIADYWEKDVVIPILIKGVDCDLLVHYFPMVGLPSLWENPTSKEKVFRTQKEARAFLAKKRIEKPPPTQ